MITGMIAGSFDLTTRGHVDVIKQAGLVVDHLTIMIATNASKASRFHSNVRKQILLACLAEENLGDCSYDVNFLDSTDLLIHQAADAGVKILFRGIRNSIDFEYEKTIADVNREIHPNIPTLFLTPKPDYAKISSSLVHGIVGTTGWQKVIANWVHKPVIKVYEIELANRYSKISGVTAQ